MPIDDDDDLFNEEFDLVDDDEFDTEVDEVEEFDDVADDLDDEVDEAEPDDGASVEDKKEQRAKSDHESAEVRQSEKPGAAARRRRGREESVDESDAEDKAAAEDLDEYGRPKPVPNYVVHIYEHHKFKRTIDRPFTPEDAEAFASEYNRTGKLYGRLALAGKNDGKPKKTLD